MCLRGWITAYATDQMSDVRCCVTLLLLLQNLYSAQIQASSSQRRWCDSK